MGKKVQQGQGKEVPRWVRMRCHDERVGVDDLKSDRPVG